MERDSRGVEDGLDWERRKGYLLDSIFYAGFDFAGFDIAIDMYFLSAESNDEDG